MNNRSRVIRFAAGTAASGLLLLVACISPVDESDIHYSELESVWQYLKAYSIYQDSSIYKGRIPDDPFLYSDPAKMMRAVQDTIKTGEYYTIYGISAVKDVNLPIYTAVDAALGATTNSTVKITAYHDSTTICISITDFIMGVTYNDLLKVLPNVWQYPNIIVDLRDNRGGDIDETKSVIEAFVPSGKSFIMAREREYNDDTRSARTINWRPWKTKDLARLELKDKQIAVLMNINSASASEILIAALKDCANATLVGSRSYGKGIGQIKIFRRERPGIQITFLQMRGVSDRIGEYHHRGIEPDIPATGDDDEVRLRAFQVFESSVTLANIIVLSKHPISPSPVGAYRVVWE